MNYISKQRKKDGDSYGNKNQKMMKWLVTVFDKTGIWDPHAIRAMHLFSTSGQKKLSKLSFFHIHHYALNQWIQSTSVTKWTVPFSLPP